MQDYIGSALPFHFGLLIGIIAVFVAYPQGGFAAFIGTGQHLHPLGNHEGRVKSQTEVSDNAVLRRVFFISFHEFHGAGKGDIADIPVNFLVGHANAVVHHRKGLVFLVQHHIYPEVFALLFFSFSQRRQTLHLGHGIAGVRDDLS